jgi:transposase
MNKRTVTKYPLEFKQSSAKLAATSDQPLTQVAQSLGVNMTTLSGWVKKFHPKTENKTSHLTQNLLEENQRLRKENSRLTQERDILKKAAAYFANELR